AANRRIGPHVTTEQWGESSQRVDATRWHPEWPLSARHRAGLLHSSRPCRPRGHPPNSSISPYLVISPKADLALHPSPLVSESDPARTSYSGCDVIGHPNTSR